MVEASKAKGWKVNKCKSHIQPAESKDDSWPKEDSTAQNSLGISQTSHQSTPVLTLGRQRRTEGQSIDNM